VVGGLVVVRVVVDVLLVEATAADLPEVPPQLVALQGRRDAAPGAGPTVPISLDRMALRRWGTTAQPGREAAEGANGGLPGTQWGAASDRSAACQGEQGGV
jgi:hypothetical protein